MFDQFRRTTYGIYAGNEYAFCDDSRPLLTGATASDLTAKRGSLIRYLFGADALPSFLPTVTADVVSPVSDLDNLSRCDQLDLAVPVSITGYPLHDTLYFRGNHFVPATGALGIACLHSGGHTHTWDDDKSPAPALIGFGDWRMINALLNAGIDVFAYHYPEFGPTTQTFSQDQLMTLIVDGPLGSPFRLWLQMPIAVVNYIESLEDYSLVASEGLSGGGMQTTWHQALDPRITLGYSVFGTAPRYLRTPINQSDLPGAWPPLYQQVGWVDLYAMAATSGKHVQIWGAGDGILGESSYDANAHPCLLGRTWSEAYDDVTAQAQAIVASTGLGTFAQHRDTQAIQHQYSWQTAEWIVSELAPS